MPTLAVRTAELPWPSEAQPPVVAKPQVETLFQPVSPAPDLFPHPAPANDQKASKQREKTAARAKKIVQFNRGEALVVVMGAAALGMLAGALIAFLVGGEAASSIAAGLWLVFAFALHQASQTFAQLLRARAWSHAALYSLHLFAFAPWPLSVMLATPDTGIYWLGLTGLLGTLAIFLFNARPDGGIVYRVCGHVMLMTAITVLQAMMLAFAH